MIFRRLCQIWVPNTLKNEVSLFEVLVFFGGLDADGLPCSLETQISPKSTPPRLKIVPTIKSTCFPLHFFSTACWVNNMQSEKQIVEAKQEREQSLQIVGGAAMTRRRRLRYTWAKSHEITGSPVPGNDQSV